MTAPRKLPALAALAMAALLAGTISAQAIDELTVSADQSQIIRLARAPATVVVGNPSMADVTIQGNLLFVHGRVAGRTNIFAIDDYGKELGEFAINVTRGDNYDAVVFKPAADGTMIKESYSCKLDCESVFQVGDSKEYFKLVSEAQKAKLGIAQGQKPGESEQAANSSENDPVQ